MTRLMMLSSCGCILLSAAVVSAAPATAPLTISTLPFDEPGQQNAVFSLLSRKLSERMNRRVKFEAGKSYSDVLKRLRTGKVDIAFLGAASYVQARRDGSVRAILKSVRNKKDGYYGVLMVKSGSPIKKIEQLRGKKIAFVDEQSTGGYHFQIALLNKSGLTAGKDYEAVFAGGHHKVVKMVAAGEVDAGACFEGAEVTLADADSVSVIARTAIVPGDPVVVRSGLGVATIKALRSALIDLATSPDAKMFFTFAELDGFVPVGDSDYDAVATLVSGH